MKIEHLAIWVTDLERTRNFYERYFGAIAGAKYHNPTKKFSSYFLSFKEGARLELMQWLQGKSRCFNRRIKNGWIFGGWRTKNNR